MLRAVFYISLLGGLLVSAYYLPKIVQSREEFKPLSESMSSDVTAVAPKSIPGSTVEVPSPLPAVSEPEPAPSPPPEPAPDLSPFATAVASGDLAKAAAFLELVKPKLEPAKYAELSQSVETARAREMAKATPPPKNDEAEKALAATQNLVVESLKQLQQSQAETSKLLAELKAQPKTAPPAPAPQQAPQAAAQPAASEDPLPGTVVIKFGHDSSLLEQQEADKLAPVLKVLASSTSAKVELRGFADKKGAAAYNLGLSNARAQSVKDVLRRAGISDSRMQIVPFGSFQASNAKPETSDDFRKVEVLVIR
jgi:outer membrane protein OmpA-like peptidoglycan-associated protein